MNSKFWNADKIVSFSAILISLGTMGIYIYQTHLIQKQQYASVMPYLKIVTSSHNESHFSFGIENDGLGPALVEEITVIYRGKRYKNKDLAKYFYQDNPNNDTLYFASGTIASGMLIPPGKELINVETQNKVTATKMKNYLWQERSLNIEIIYSSIYGEKWIINTKDYRPIKIED